ncbi:MAG: polysaccharide biosynthesis protein [Rikenellaceae bacterium]
MSENSANNKRIAKNTFMLYMRQIIVMAVGFYSVRVVLSVLGVENYGIYNVVGGVVSMLSFLSGTMASATQRFFSFYLGLNDSEKLKKVFSVNCVLYLLLLAVVFVALESGGLWFVKNHLEIPEGRESAVLFIYKFSVLTFLVSMISSPFVAAINAHEDMQIFAYISIIEALLKLSIVYMLSWISFDKLELYSILLFAATSLTTLIYIATSLIKYAECQITKLYWDYSIFKEVMGYTGWTLFGQVTTTARMQGVTILINQYFTPITVASRAIASQITGQLNSFAGNFNRSLYPPIIKSYSSGRLREMYQLVYRGSKIAFFLMWVLSLPIWVYMDKILSIWLDVVPERAVLFTRLSLIEVLIQSISYSIMTAARAPGKMRNYELILGLMQFAFFGAVWYIVSLGYPDYSVYVAIIILNIAMFFVRLIIVRGLTGLPLRGFVLNVVLRMGGVVVGSLLPFIFMSQVVPYSFISMLVVMVVGTLINCLMMYFIGLSGTERAAVLSMVLSKIKK